MSRPRDYSIMCKVEFKRKDEKDSTRLNLYGRALDGCICPVLIQKLSKVTQDNLYLARIEIRNVPSFSSNGSYNDFNSRITINTWLKMKFASEQRTATHLIRDFFFFKQNIDSNIHYFPAYNDEDDTRQLEFLNHIFIGNFDSVSELMQHLSPSGIVDLKRLLLDENKAFSFNLEQVREASSESNSTIESLASELSEQHIDEKEEDEEDTDWVKISEDKEHD